MRTKFSEFIQVVSEHFDVPVAQIVGSSKIPHIVEARHTAIYLWWRYSNRSLAGVGIQFGNLDHTSVIYACRKMEKLPENLELVAALGLRGEVRK